MRRSRGPLDAGEQGSTEIDPPLPLSRIVSLGMRKNNNDDRNAINCEIIEHCAWHLLQAFERSTPSPPPPSVPCALSFHRGNRGPAERSGLVLRARRFFGVYSRDSELSAFTHKSLGLTTRLLTLFSGARMQGRLRLILTPERDLTSRWNYKSRRSPGNPISSFAP